MRYQSKKPAKIITRSKTRIQALLGAAKGNMATNNRTERADEEPDIRVSITEAKDMIPFFSGDKNELNRFIACCDDLFGRARDGRDQSLFFNVLKTRISGPPYDIIDYGGATNWTELRAGLLKKYKVSRSAAREELKRMRQGPRESVNDFAIRVTRTLGELNKATAAQIVEKSARKIFLEENEKDAIHTFEYGLKNERLQVLAQTRNETELSTLIDYIMERSAVLEEKDRNPRDEQANGSNRFNIICTVCNKKGHTKENCYRNRLIPSFNGPQIKKEVRRIICSYCNKPNHHISECRTRKYDDNARNNRSNQGNFQQTRANFSNGAPQQGRNRSYTNRYDQQERGNSNNLRQVRAFTYDEEQDSKNDSKREGTTGPLSRNVEVMAAVHRQD